MKLTKLEKQLNDLSERLPIYVIEPYGYTGTVPRWRIIGECGEKFLAATLSAAVNAALAFCDSEDEER